MCGGDVRSILLLLIAIDVCIWHMFVFCLCSDCVGGGSMGMFVV